MCAGEISKEFLFCSCFTYLELRKQETVYLDWCTKIWRYIEEHFLDEENGGDWWGYLRRDGTIFNKLKVIYNINNLKV